MMPATLFLPIAINIVRLTPKLIVRASTLLKVTNSINESLKDAPPEASEECQDKINENHLTATGSGGSPNNQGPDEEKEEGKKSNFNKGDNIGLLRFTKKDKNGRLTDPKTRQYLEREMARNSGNGGHGGSYWKLYNRKGERMGTISKDGRWLRK